MLSQLLAPIAGAFVTLSLAPFDWWPMGILSCAIFAYLLATCTPKQAAWQGWLFGLGVFGSGASWVYVSIHVHGAANPALAGLLTLFWCAGLALLHALFGWFYARFVRQLPGGVWLGFAALWVLFEWLRSWLLTGFPWLYLGYAHVDTWISGWAPLVGVYGLSFIIAITGSCLYRVCHGRDRGAAIACGLVVGILWVGGNQLKSLHWVAPSSNKPISVALYQPNIPQERKWDRRWYKPILQQYSDALPTQYGHDIVVWPESAIPNIYQQARSFLDPVAQDAAAANTTLITGIPYRSADGKSYHNSIVALGNGRGVYHKQRLVPFGEFVPLEGLLRGLIAFFDLPMSAFTAGDKEQMPLQAGDYRVAPFICYEVVYPDLVAQSAADADLLVTISNDSWFGKSIGPLQHLQMAQMRALENGRYMIRGTNNGVSAIINHRGDVEAQSTQFVTTTLEGDIQLMVGTTAFSRFGSLPTISASAGALLLMAILYLLFWRDID